MERRSHAAGGAPLRGRRRLCYDAAALALSRLRIALLGPLLCLLIASSARANEAMDLLWAHRLLFAADGSPLVTVRIDEGEGEIRLRLRGEGALVVGEERIPLPRGASLRLRAVETRPARLRWSVQVAEISFADREAAQRAIATWRGRGFEVRTAVLGGVFGFRGRVIDNRRYAILLGAGGTRDEAQRLLEEAATWDDGVLDLFAELVERPAGRIVVHDERGRIASGEGAVAVEAADGIVVRDVEHDIGYASHGRQDRAYRGTVYVTVDAGGRTAAVNALPLEDLVRGIVPSEIYASAPLEALKAQAVTARGEILAKIGVRHRADPWLLCAEQHCQVYKGMSGEHPQTDRAIAASRGEVLLGREGRLVDSVYSSTCGGHTENNEAVWGTPPDPHLRGVPDWIDSASELEPFAAGVTDVEAWLAADVPAMCGASGFTRPEKYRWERRFSAAEMDAVGARLGIGPVLSIAVTGRGVSGRATGLAFTGTRGATVVQGELAIRRLLGNLNSSLFVVEREGDAERPTGWRFRGAGWGHGVGMCQTGAIGRAERGHDHRSILGHYYGGAQPVPLY